MCERCDDQVLWNRRAVLAGAAGLAGVLAAPASLYAATGGRSVRLYVPNTGESLSVTYWKNGSYSSKGLSRINHLLRDWRTGEVRKVDPKLVDMLYGVRLMLHTNAPLHILSGYRSVGTNDLLKSQGLPAANRSLHSYGRAVDLAVPGRSARAVRIAATRLRRGGVGVYSTRGSVHLDTGRIRNWEG